MMRGRTAFVGTDFESTLRLLQILRHSSALGIIIGDAGCGVHHASCVSSFQ